LNRGILAGPQAASVRLDDRPADGPTERETLRFIANFRSHQTIIVISHRIRSLVGVDRFVLLDQGRIVATGTHSALYAQFALYRTLYESSTQDMGGS
jgi:ATP-binding cassette, subfamily B, bacterial IrtB/YbtQ